MKSNEVHVRVNGSFIWGKGNAPMEVADFGGSLKNSGKNSSDVIKEKKSTHIKARNRFR